MNSRDGVRMNNRGEEVEPVKKTLVVLPTMLIKYLQPRKSRTKPGQNSPKKINYLLVRILQ